eukprot:14383251-Alexandrium_andersonii.AAC.1
MQAGHRLCNSAPLHVRQQSVSQAQPVVPVAATGTIARMFPNNDGDRLRWGVLRQSRWPPPGQGAQQ